jgi:Domain of unknown function (DUF5666)
VKHAIDSARRTLALQAALATLSCCLVGGCGGGGQVTGTGVQVASGGVGGTGGGGGQGTGGGGGVGGTGVVALGPLAKTQANQIAVNGTTFDTTTATQVRIDDATTTAAALEDGMLVLVAGHKDQPAQNFQAQTVTYRSNVRGPVESIAPNCASMVVLGQPVLVNANTKPALKQGTCDFTLGEILDVNGLVTDKQSNKVLATFVRRNAAPGAFEVAGTIASASPPNKTFVIGTLTVEYEEAEIIPQGSVPAAGSNVLVRGEAASPGTLKALKVEISNPNLGGSAGTEAHLDGFVSGLSGSKFNVSGQAVDASAAVLDSHGLSLANGRRVEIEGKFDAHGVVIATKVEIKLD